jgi:AcrR family transcriptional regulator
MMKNAAMARPSLAPLRREQILDALERCLAKRGLEGTSLEAVAAAAGVARPVIRHYFGNRDALLAAALERAVSAYAADLARALGTLPREDRLGAFLDHLFLGRFVGQPERERLLRALFAGLEQEGVRPLLLFAYRRFEQACFAVLRADAPRAPTPAVRAAAYAIACLAEQNAGFLTLGFPRSRARAARAAAAQLARTLKETHDG